MGQKSELGIELHWNLSLTGSAVSVCATTLVLSFMLDISASRIIYAFSNLSVVPNSLPSGINLVKNADIMRE